MQEVVLSKHVQEIVSEFKTAKHIDCYKGGNNKLILIKNKNYFFTNYKDNVFELSDDRNITFEDLEFADLRTQDNENKLITLGQYQFRIQG